MRLLILGGTRFVGRAVADAAVQAGWQVSLVNRGVTRGAPAGVTTLRGDRTQPAGLSALKGREFDAVVDTWSGAPRIVAAAADALADRAARYVYLSSRSVYADPLPRGAGEDAAVVAADPDEDTTSYPRDKRGGELAVERAFGPERGALLRCGLILGPHEDVGRLPWWLTRIHRGGDVLAPGPPSLPLQYVDARDLAQLVLACAVEGGAAGALNVSSRRGHATMKSLLQSCVAVTASGARLVWADPADVLDAGIAPWVELPVWIPPDDDASAMHDGNTDRAHASGLRCRPVTETVADTWAWVAAGGWTGPPPGRPVGLDPAKEEAVLAAIRGVG